MSTFENWSTWNRAGMAILLIALVVSVGLYVNERNERVFMMRQNENDFQRSFFHLNDMLIRIQNEFENMELIHEPSAQKRSWAHVWRYSQLALADFTHLPLVWQPMEKTQQFLHELQQEAYRRSIHPMESKTIKNPQAKASVHEWSKRTKDLRLAMEKVQRQVSRSDSDWNGIIPSSQTKASTNTKMNALYLQLDGVEKLNGDASATGKKNSVHSLSVNSTEAPRKGLNETTVRTNAEKWIRKIDGNTERNKWQSVHIGQKDSPKGCLLQSKTEELELTGSDCTKLKRYNSNVQPGPWKMTTADARKKVMQWVTTAYGGKWAIEQLQPNHRWITVKLVPMQQNTRLLEDYVTVRIAMEQGKMLSVDASAYLANHRMRTLPVVRWDQTAMLELLDPSVNWQYGYSLMRRNEFGEDVRCARWFGRFDGKEMQVDINTSTGEVENVERWIAG